MEHPLASCPYGDLLKEVLEQVEVLLYRRDAPLVADFLRQVPEGLSAKAQQVAEWTRADVDEALAAANRCLCQLSLSDSDSFFAVLSFLLPSSLSSGRQHLFSVLPAFPALSQPTSASPAGNLDSSDENYGAKTDEEGDEQDATSSKSAASSTSSRKKVVSLNAGKIYHATRRALKQNGGAAALLLLDEEKINPLNEEAASELHFTHEAFCRFCEPGCQDCPYDTARLSYVLTLAQLLFCNRHNNAMEEIPKAAMAFCFDLLSPEQSPPIRHAVGFVLGLMSRYHLRDLCQLFMNKMITIKPRDPTYIYYQRGMKHFDFGVRTVPQINTTILFMTYCRQLMLKARGHSMRLEICNTLNHIFKHIMCQADAWLVFPRMPALHNQFWALYRGIYGVLGKWIQKKESYAAFSYALMVTMVTLANREFIDEHGEDLIARLISCAKSGRERDWEAKDEVDAAERKGSRNREKEQSRPVDKQDVTSPAPSSSSPVSASASTNATLLLSSSPYHYLSLILGYLRTLNDAYVREGGESYTRQIQTATQFLFAWQIASSEQCCLLEQIAQAIAQRDARQGLAMVLSQLPRSGTNVTVLQLSLGLSVLSYMLKHQADMMKPYQTKFLAFFGSIWGETGEPEPRVLAGILHCVPFLDIPVPSRQRITLRIVRSLAWATGVEERQSGVNALAFVFAKYADEVLLAGLSAMLAHLEGLDERRLIINTDSEEHARERHFQNLLELLQTYLQLAPPLPPKTPLGVLSPRTTRPAHEQWRELRHRIEAVCLLRLASPDFSSRSKALSVLDLFNSRVFRQHEAITRRTCMLVNEVRTAKATDSEEHLWSPTLTYIFERKQTELAGVIYSSWVQSIRRMQRGAFDLDRVTRAEYEKLQEWKNHLRFLLWALPSAFRPETNGDTSASLPVPPLSDINQSCVDMLLRHVATAVNHSTEMSNHLIEVLAVGTPQNTRCKDDTPSGVLPLWKDARVQSYCVELLLCHLSVASSEASEPLATRRLFCPAEAGLSSYDEPLYTQPGNVELLALFARNLSTDDTTSELVRLLSDTVNAWLGYHADRQIRINPAIPPSTRLAAAVIVTTVVRRMGAANDMGAKAEAVLSFLASLLFRTPLKQRRSMSTSKSPRSSYRGLLNLITHSSVEGGGKKDIIQRIEETIEKEARDEQQERKSGGSERKTSISEPFIWEASEPTTEGEIAVELEVMNGAACLLALDATEDLVDEVELFLVSFVLARKNVNPRTASALVEGLVQMGRHYPSRIGSFARNALQSDVCHMVVGTKSLSSYQQRQRMQTGRYEGINVLRLAYTEAVARSINLHVFQTTATDSFENVVLLCILALLSDDEQFQRQGSLLADQIELHVVQHSETADNYLADVFPASSNFAESLVRGRAQRFSERLAKAYPTRTAVMLKQAACQCTQTTGVDRAAPILECLKPWTRNYGRQLLRAADDAAREKVQEIVQVLFKLSLMLWSNGNLRSCLERLWVATVSSANASVSVPALMDFLAGRVLSAMQPEREATLALGMSVCSFLAKGECRTALLDSLISRLRDYTASSSSFSYLRKEEIIFYFLMDIPLVDTIASERLILNHPHFALTLQNALVIFVRNSNVAAARLPIGKRFLLNLLFAVAKTTLPDYGTAAPADDRARVVENLPPVPSSLYSSSSIRLSSSSFCAPLGAASTSFSRSPSPSASLATSISSPSASSSTNIAISPKRLSAAALMIRETGTALCSSLSEARSAAAEAGLHRRPSKGADRDSTDAASSSKKKFLLNLRSLSQRSCKQKEVDKDKGKGKAKETEEAHDSDEPPSPRRRGLLTSRGRSKSIKQQRSARLLEPQPAPVDENPPPIRRGRSATLPDSLLVSPHITTRGESVNTMPCSARPSPTAKLRSEPAVFVVPSPKKTLQVRVDEINRDREASPTLAERSISLSLSRAGRARTTLAVPLFAQGARSRSNDQCSTTSSSSPPSSPKFASSSSSVSARLFSLTSSPSQRRRSKGKAKKLFRAANINDDFEAGGELQPARSPRKDAKRQADLSSAPWVSAAVRPRHYTEQQTAFTAGETQHSPPHRPTVSDPSPHFRFIDEMMDELRDPAPAHSLAVSLSRVVPHLALLSPELRHDWTRLSLEWGLRAEEADIAVASLELFHFLGAAAHVSESSAPADLQRVAHALVCSLNTHALRAHQQPRDTANAALVGVDTSAKSQLLFDVLLKLLDKCPSSVALREGFAISVALMRVAGEGHPLRLHDHANHYCAGLTLLTGLWNRQPTTFLHSLQEALPSLCGLWDVTRDLGLILSPPPLAKCVVFTLMGALGRHPHLLKDSLAALKLLFRVYQHQFAEAEEADRSLSIAMQSVLWLDLVNIVFASFEYYSPDTSAGEANSDGLQREMSADSDFVSSEDEEEQEEHHEHHPDVIRESTSPELKEMLETANRSSDGNNGRRLRDVLATLVSSGGAYRTRTRARDEGLQRVKRIISESIEFYLNHMRAQPTTHGLDAFEDIYGQFLAALPGNCHSKSSSYSSSSSSSEEEDQSSQADGDVTVLNGLMQTFMQSFFAAFPDHHDFAYVLELSLQFLRGGGKQPAWIVPTLTLLTHLVLWTEYDLRPEELKDIGEAVVQCSLSAGSWVVGAADQLLAIALERTKPAPPPTVFDLLGSMALHKRAGDSSPAMTLMGLSVEDVPALLNPNLGTTRKEKRKAVFLASSLSASSSSSASPSPPTEKKPSSVAGGESSTPRRPRVPSLSLGLSAIARFSEEEEERKLRRLHDHHQREDEEGGNNDSKEPIAPTATAATRSGKMNKMRSLASLRLLKRKGVRGEATTAANNKDTNDKEHNKKKKEKQREKAAMKRKKSEGERARSELMVPGGPSPRAECDAKEAEDDRSYFQRRQRGHTLPANAPRTLGTSN